MGSWNSIGGSPPPDSLSENASKSQPPPFPPPISSQRTYLPSSGASDRGGASDRQLTSAQSERAAPMSLDSESSSTEVESS